MDPSVARFNSREAPTGGKPKFEAMLTWGKKSNSISRCYVRGSFLRTVIGPLIAKPPPGTVNLEPRRAQPGLGPVVISLAAGAMMLLAGLLVNGCRTTKLRGSATEARQPLAVDPSAVRDSALVGSSTARVTTLSVSNSGGWSASTRNGWIRTSPASGTSRETVHLTLDPKTLTPGTHEGLVTVREKKEGGDSVIIDVSFVILQPVLAVDPDNLSYSARTSNSVFSDTLRVMNKGNGPLVWTARLMHGSDWVTLGATSGDQPGTIPVRVTNEGLNFFATYRDTIVVEAEGAKDSPFRIPLLLKRKH